jgi:probable addiction module antidote protein
MSTKSTTGQGFSQWDPAEHLRTPEEQRAYLNACLDEDPGDGRLVRAALGDIARARGMSSLARATGISREGLYRALSDEGNPEFATIMRVLRALGLQLRAA